MEDQVVNFFIRQVCICRNEVVVDRLLANFFAVDTGTVIGQFDHNATRPMFRCQANSTFRILAKGNTFFRCFQTMVHSIADHMCQRLSQLINNCFIYFGVFTFGDQSNRFPGHISNIANDTRHALEDRFYRLSSNCHNTVLDFPGQLLQLVEPHIHGGFAIVVIFNNALRQHRLVDHKLANQVDQTVNTVKIHADGCACCSAPARSNCFLRRGFRGGGWLGFGSLAGRRCCVDNFRGDICSGHCVICIGTNLIITVVNRHDRLFVESADIKRDRLHRQFFFGSRRPSIGIYGFNVELAIPFCKFKNLANAFFALLGLDRDFPGKVRSLRIHLIKWRELGHIAVDAHLANAG